MQFRLLSKEETVKCFLKTCICFLSLSIGRSHAFLSLYDNTKLTALTVVWVLLHLFIPLSRSLPNTSDTGRQVFSVVPGFNNLPVSFSFLQPNYVRLTGHPCNNAVTAAGRSHGKDTTIIRLSSSYHGHLQGSAHRHSMWPEFVCHLFFRVLDLLLGGGRSHGPRPVS